MRDEHFLFLFVDNGALIFNNMEELIKSSKITFRQMKILGLYMHLGKEKKSKTEAVNFSSRSVVVDYVTKETLMKKTMLKSELLQISDSSIQNKYPLK